jgi:hypothetical protein
MRVLEVYIYVHGFPSRGYICVPALVLVAYWAYYILGTLRVGIFVMGGGLISQREGYRPENWPGNNFMVYFLIFLGVWRTSLLSLSLQLSADSSQSKRPRIKPGTYLHGRRQVH